MDISIKIKISMIILYKKHGVKIWCYIQELCCLQLKMKILLGYNMKIVISRGYEPLTEDWKFEGGSAVLHIKFYILFNLSK